MLLSSIPCLLVNPQGFLGLGQRSILFSIPCKRFWCVECKKLISLSLSSVSLFSPSFSFRNSLSWLASIAILSGFCANLCGFPFFDPQPSWFASWIKVPLFEVVPPSWIQFCRKAEILVWRFKYTRIGLKRPDFSKLMLESFDNFPISG